MLCLRSASACFTDDSDTVRVVDEEHVAELSGEFDQLWYRRQVAFHAEHSVGGHKPKPVGGFA